MPTAPPTETTVLEAAMTECRRRLDRAREDHDDLNADLLEADLNRMLERWEVLHATSA